MESSAPGNPLPLVVQLGFSGSRKLCDFANHPALDPEKFHAAVEDHLRGRLETLPAELGLSPQHFLCGISQIAIGADTLFTRACASLEMPQRIFLPQHRDEYLTAGSKSGSDFSEPEKATARELLKSPHLIQLRVVSDAADRNDRFHETQLEITRVSDLLVCLIRPDASNLPGGTRAIIELAKKRRRPTLVITVSIENDRPVFEETWHHRDRFHPPVLPAGIARATLPEGSPPTIAAYCGVLKSLGNLQADWQRKLFRIVAAIIIGTHILATICAVLAMGLLHDPQVLPWLLAVELLFLAGGFMVHQYLHRSRACNVWAMSRTVAEIARSVAAIGPIHLYLEPLFTLPFPATLRPLLRTISVLHLRATHHSAGTGSWQEMRDTYLAKRLTDPEFHAQLPYHRQVLQKSKRSLRRAHHAFLFCTIAAFLATAAKLVSSFAGHASHGTSVAESILGSLAIILPVLAVAALSLAAAFDLEARVHTAEEMIAFLDQQKNHLKHAGSPREVARLLLETETRLLGEVANWQSRRSFTGIA